MNFLGLILFLAGVIGCILAIGVTALYTVINGDKYGCAKKTRKEGLYIFGTPLIVGAILIIVSLI